MPLNSGAITNKIHFIFHHHCIKHAKSYHQSYSMRYTPNGTERAIFVYFKDGEKMHSETLSFRTCNGLVQKLSFYELLHPVFVSIISCISDHKVLYPTPLPNTHTHTHTHARARALTHTHIHAHAHAHTTGLSGVHISVTNECSSHKLHTGMQQ